MDDGWETARNPNRPAVLGVGPDGMLDLPASMAEWAIMRLACEVNVEEVCPGNVLGLFCFCLGAVIFFVLYVRKLMLSSASTHSIFVFCY